MSQEITVTASLSVYKPAIMSSALSASITGALFSMAGSVSPMKNTVSLGTSDTTIPMGSVTLPHWAYFRNMDSTNYCRIKHQAAGTSFLKLLAGECAFLPLDPANTALVGIADTAPVPLEYLICQL